MSLTQNLGGAIGICNKALNPTVRSAELRATEGKLQPREIGRSVLMA
jgi:hypothetical protein